MLLGFHELIITERNITLELIILLATINPTLQTHWKLDRLGISNFYKSNFISVSIICFIASFQLCIYKYIQEKEIYNHLKVYIGLPLGKRWARNFNLSGILAKAETFLSVTWSITYLSSRGKNRMFSTVFIIFPNLLLPSYFEQLGKPNFILWRRGCLRVPEHNNYLMLYQLPQ